MLLAAVTTCVLLSGKIDVAEYRFRNFAKLKKKDFRDGNNEKKDRLQPIYIVIYPYIFSDFVYSLLELGDFEPYCNVEVWDISLIVTPKFSKKLSMSTSDNKDVFLLTSFADFVRHVLKLKIQSRETKENKPF